MSDTGKPRKLGWWRDVVVAFVVGFGVSAYYSVKLSGTQKRAEQAEAQLKRVGQAGQAASPPPGTVGEAPKNLECPEGTTLQRVVSVEEFLKDSKAQGTQWECIGKPKPVADLAK